jgi:hypothetical protein
MNNREIKFRVWDKEDLCWIDSSHLRINYDGVLYLPYGIAPERNTKRFIIQQYTGLKDSQGVEIYEGDIILNDEDKEIVRWGFCGWLCGNESFVGVDIQSIEVVGNIFENPELLKTNE